MQLIGNGMRIHANWLTQKTWIRTTKNSLADMEQLK